MTGCSECNSHTVPTGHLMETIINQ
uniref:Uncharacterized protein n=1 Tax=Arundo donax TaxID=35708 RepID=A0A0A9EII1_ARUDO